jgi:N-acetylglucosamine malate deacetylase 1
VAKIKNMKLDILAFGAHPDDVELGCSGTIAKEVNLGKKAGIIDLTRGELGTRGSVETRNSESAKASDILGVSVRENLDMRDGFFVNDEAHQLKVIQMIRKYQPEIVLCNAIDDRHIDHGKGSKLVSDACFLSGLRQIKTELNGEVQEAWRPKVVYHYIQWKNIEPDFVVDISAFMETKMNSVLAYGSQFYDPKSNEPVTPIASKNFLESIKYRAQDLGRLVGVEYAEGFTTERYLAVNSLCDLK